MPKYEIYALKFAGPLTSSGAFVMWMKGWEEVVERSYYFWCLKNREATILVDAGVAPPLAKERNLPGYVNPEKMLSKIGVAADSIKHIILSHIHWDHADGLILFPKANVYVQKAEYRFWLQDDMAYRPPFQFFITGSTQKAVEVVKESGRLKFLDGDKNILPGIECLLAPGHSIALQAVAVNTARGTAILGSDCGHLFKNYQERWPSALIVDMVAWMHSFEKLESRVSSPELLFPGHDSLMTSNYPEVAPGITRLA